MTLFDRVKTTAKLRGFSLAELARRANIGEKTIYTWKPSKSYPDGVSPSREILEKVAKELSVDVNYLLGNDERKEPDNNSLSDNQKLIAYSIDPDISDEERDAIIEMVKAATKLRRRL